MALMQESDGVLKLWQHPNDSIQKSREIGISRNRNPNINSNYKRKDINKKPAVCGPVCED